MVIDWIVGRYPEMMRDALAAADARPSVIGLHNMHAHLP
jgi:hypothetical protein